uniref:Uncharacterized protein n=1 Tax=Panagrolaimus sp. ES5 TaxID=591445 RepID=A0AC34FY50_9BILA
MPLKKNSVYTPLLISADLAVNVAETIAVVGVTKSGYVFTEFVFTDFGYQELRQEKVEASGKDNPKIYRDKIIGENDTKKFIFSSPKNIRLHNFLTRKVLKSTNVPKIVRCVPDNSSEEYISKFVVEVSKWLMDQIYVKYHIIPTCSKRLVGNELFISFKNKKPLFFKKALEPVKSQSTDKDDEIPAIVTKCVVYDLIKILSIPIDDPKVEENWKFEFTKDSENPILIKFDDREDDEKLLSPPTLIMALFLKEHKKAVKAETGKKPDKFGFCILDENYGL